MNRPKKRGADERKEKILIVEDNKSLREGLQLNFSLQGYEVLTARDGEEGMRSAFDADPDLIVLDIMLPGSSGLDILTELRARKRNVPVLILSARDKTREKIQGLDLGADDYVTKPFELPELLARVEAMLRRRRVEIEAQRVLTFGEVEVDTVERRLRVNGEEVVLSAKEFDLICLLAGTPGRPYTRDAILDRVWGWDFDGTTRTVDNFIMSLRKKIEADPAKPRHIQTVRQVGYKLEP